MAAVSAQHARTQATIWKKYSIGRDFLIVGETLNRDFRIQQIRQVLFGLPIITGHHPTLQFPFIRSSRKQNIREKHGLIRKSWCHLRNNYTSDLLLLSRQDPHTENRGLIDVLHYLHAIRKTANEQICAGSWIKGDICDKQFKLIQKKNRVGVPRIYVQQLRQG